MLLRGIEATDDEPLALQAKLEIGAVDDPLEREANAAADRVRRMAPAPPPLSAGDPRVSRQVREGPAPSPDAEPATQRGRQAS